MPEQAQIGDVAAVVRKDGAGDKGKEHEVKVTLVGKLVPLPSPAKGFDAQLEAAIEIRQGPLGKVVQVARGGGARGEPVKLAECARIG